MKFPELKEFYRDYTDPRDLGVYREELVGLADALSKRSELSESDLKEVRLIKEEIDNLDRRIEAREAAEKAHIRKIVAAGNGKEHKAPAGLPEPDTTLVVDEQFIQSKRFREKRKYFANRDNSLGGFIKRALGSTTGSSFIPTDYVDPATFDAIANNDLAELGTRFIMKQEGTKGPRITGYNTPDWQANEGDELALSDATIGSTDFLHSDVGVRFYVNNQLLVDAAYAIDSILQEAAIIGINNAILGKFFNGDGSAGTPTGLDNTTGVNTVAGGSVVLGDYAEIRAAVYQLLKDNVQMERIGMLAHPVVWYQLSGLEDTTGQPLRKPMGIDEMPMRWTSAIDINQGAGTDTSIYLGDYSKAVVSMQGPWRYQTDNRQSRLQTEFILWVRVAFGFEQPDHFCIVQNVGQGATT